MELDELLKLNDNEIINGQDSEGNRYIGQLLRHYSIRIGRGCMSCPKYFKGYINELRNNKMTTKSQFKLKGDTVIRIWGTTDFYSNANLTDEAVYRILGRTPSLISCFDNPPKNWKEMVEAYKIGEVKAPTPADLEELTVPQIRALFPTAKGRSKADLIASVEEEYPELSE